MSVTLARSSILRSAAAVVLAPSAALAQPTASSSSTVDRWGEITQARTRNKIPSYSGLAGAVYMACLGMAGQHAVAQEPVEEITITGSRLITSGVNTPTPVTAVTSADLQAMAPTTLIESLSQLPVFENNLTSQQASGGSVASGGSNLNLRGIGGEGE